MKKELELQLKEKFPKLYKILHIGKNEEDPFWGIQVWGFECNDGWYDIIYHLSEKIEPLIEKDEDSDSIYVVQVKEKFGGLRFYMNTLTNEIDKLIHEAMEESFITCEDCGKPGTLRTKGWNMTLCDDCAVIEGKM
jgi:hypothetical protein